MKKVKVKVTSEDNILFEVIKVYMNTKYCVCVSYHHHENKLKCKG